MPWSRTCVAAVRPAQGTLTIRRQRPGQGSCRRNRYPYSEELRYRTCCFFRNASKSCTHALRRYLHEHSPVNRKIENLAVLFDNAVIEHDRLIDVPVLDVQNLCERTVPLVGLAGLHLNGNHTLPRALDDGVAFPHPAVCEVIKARDHAHATLGGRYCPTMAFTPWAFWSLFVETRRTNPYVAAFCPPVARVGARPVPLGGVVLGHAPGAPGPQPSRFRSSSVTARFFSSTCRRRPSGRPRCPTSRRHPRTGPQSALSNLLTTRGIP